MMRTNAMYWVTVGLFCMIISAAAHADSIVVDPATGNYIVTYRSVDEPHPIERVVWVPGTKINPVVRSAFRVMRGQLIHYGYTIRNDAKWHQNIRSFGITVSTIEANSQHSPPEWDEMFAGNYNPNVNGGAGYNGGWFYNNDKEPLGGIEPGRSLGGFDLESPDIPGVAIMQLTGATPPDQSFPDEGPEENSPISGQFDDLTMRNYVPRFVAVPSIPVPSPFAAAPVLTALQKHVDQDLVAMKLIDPSLVSVLDPLFQSAITAAQGGNNEALRGDLRALRRAISDERGQEEKAENADDACEVEDRGEKTELSHTQPIANIARQVLDFDFKYIEHAVKPGHDASDK